MQVSQKKALLQVLLEFVNIVKKFSQQNGIMYTTSVYMEYQ